MLAKTGAFIRRVFSSRKNQNGLKFRELMLTWENSIADTLCPLRTSVRGASLCTLLTIWKYQFSVRE